MPPLLIMKILSRTSVLKIKTTEAARLRSELFLRDRYSDEPLPLYTEIEPGVFEVPVGYLDGHTDAASWKKIDVTFTGTLRDDQESVAQYYLDHIKKTNGGIIKADTGFGKTVLATALISEIGLKTLIIVPTSHLMNQWRERLKTFSDLRDDDIGIIKGPIKEIHGRKVVIGMIQTISQNPDRFRMSEFGLLVYDEVHTLAAPTFSTTAKLFHAKYRLGLSATPRRKDGMEKVFLYHIGKVVVEGKNDHVSTTVLQVWHNGAAANHAGYVWNGKFNFGGYYNKLIKIEQRNRMIATVTAKAYGNNRDILVVSDRLDHLSRLEQLLLELGVEKKDIGYFVGDRKELDKKILLGTYGSAGLGADLPRLNTIVLATPRSDIEQTVGRIFRGTYSKTPTIIDVIDSASVKMLQWSMARTRYYEKKLKAKIFQYGK